MKENKIEELASDILQKTREAMGTLNVIDDLMVELEDKIGSELLWSLRNANRNLDSCNENAAKIIELVEKSVYEERGLRSL